MGRVPSAPPDQDQRGVRARRVETRHAVAHLGTISEQLEDALAISAGATGLVFSHPAWIPMIDCAPDFHMYERAAMPAAEIRSKRRNDHEAENECNS